MACATVVAAVSIVAVEFGQPPQAALAATPPMLQYQPPATFEPAAERLRQLADVAAASPPLPRPPGTVEHLRSASWGLNSAISGGATTSVVQPQERESWRTDDDAGRLITRNLPPAFQSEADRNTWLRKGGTEESQEEIINYRAGAFYESWKAAVPTEADSLRRWLVVNRSEHDAPVQYLEDIAELASVRLLGPAQRSAALRLLADLPGVTVTGTVTDRAGRRGDAFSMESDAHGLPARYTIIIDPVDGNLLGYEEVLTTTAGKLNVPIPAVISYRSYLVGEYAPMPR